MKRTVYAVATGEYSDYMIEAIFTSHEEAQKLLDRGVGHRSWISSVAGIDEFELYDTADEAVLGVQWQGVARWDGAAWDIQADYQGLSIGAEPDEREPFMKATGRYRDGSPDPPPVIVCYGRSEEQVRKALSEYIAAYHGQMNT